MAVRSRGSGMAAIVALVIFVVLFLAGAGLAIVAYTNWQDEKKKAADLQERLTIYVSPAEETIDAIKDIKGYVKDANAKGARTSVVGYLLNSRTNLMKTIFTSMGTPEGLEDWLIKNNIKKDPKAPADAPDPRFVDLFSTIETLKKDITSLTKQKVELTKERDDATAKVALVETQKADIEKAYREKDVTRTQQVSQIGDASTATQAAAVKTFGELKTSQEAAAVKFKEDLEKIETTLATREAELQQAKDTIEKLRALITPASGGIGTTAEFTIDGKILSTIPQENLVTINLGQNDRVPIGMTFEVFDKKKGVSRDQFGDVRGKASIEVAKVKESSCECRVVRLERGQTVFEDDVIVNTVYDKHRTYRFFVYGQYDIDNDGRATDADTRRVKSMIQQWGGIIVTSLTYEVDFLVLGKRPEQPNINKETATPDEIEAAAAQEAEFRKFIELEGLARLLRIPILNQNRFLTLIGHYERWEK